MMTTTCSRLLAIAALVLSATAAAAQTAHTDLSTLDLTDLLNLEVSTASKFPQPVTRAPASITILTGDEIRRVNYRTLADVLASVRGFYVTNDRNYTYAGVRGFARPGDYNTRVLLLIDGHRLNDPIYDMAAIGADFPVDVEDIDRVELVRGPGSSLYGTNALLAIVNVITRNGSEGEGGALRVEGGNLGMYRGRASISRLFSTSGSMMLSSSFEHTGGPGTLYFPEFDAANTNHGLVSGNDHERAGRVFGAISRGALSIHAAFDDRHKRVPTASYGTAFGDPRLATVDARGYADAQYTGAFGRGWNGIVHVSFDHYDYQGTYPYQGANDVTVFEDFARADWLTGELTANRRLGLRHLITSGVETRYALRETQYSHDQGVTTVYEDRRSGTTGFYLQDELSLTRRWTAIGGARVDFYGEVGNELSPRAGLVYNPTPLSALKVMYGHAFRAPDAYERYYYDRNVAFPSSLRPERVRSLEGTWEQFYGSRLRSTVTVFRSSVSNIITQMPDATSDDGLYFANVARSRSYGLETEIEGRVPNGLLARTSYAWTSAVDQTSHAQLSNSPAHLAKYLVLAPLGRSHLFVAATGSYTASRMTVVQKRLPSTYVQNATITAERVGTADLSLGIYNLFDLRYGDPGGEEHVETGIPQDGRSFRAALTFRF